MHCYCESKFTVWFSYRLALEEDDFSIKRYMFYQRRH